MNRIPLGLSLCLALAGVASANIVTNPGFETGDFTGWTFNASTDHPWGVTSSNPHSGTFAASTGCVGAHCVDTTNLANASYLSQILTTTAGDSYTLTFWFQGAGEAEDLKVLWGGSVVLDLCPATTGCTNINNTAYQQYTVSNLAASASTTELMFLARQDPSYDRLDDVDVEFAGTASAPEPGSAALLLGGGLLLFHRVASKRRAASKPPARRMPGTLKSRM